MDTCIYGSHYNSRLGIGAFPNDPNLVMTSIATEQMMQFDADDETTGYDTAETMNLKLLLIQHKALESKGYLLDFPQKFQLSVWQMMSLTLMTDITMLFLRVIFSGMDKDNRHYRYRYSSYRGNATPTYMPFLKISLLTATGWMMSLTLIH